MVKSKITAQAITFFWKKFEQDNLQRSALLSQQTLSFLQKCLFDWDLSQSFGHRAEVLELAYYKP